MFVEVSYSRNMAPVVYKGEPCHISHHTDTAANVHIPSADRDEWIAWEFLTDSLFAPELDGDTFDTPEAAHWYREVVA